MVKEEEERLDREVKTKTLIMSDSTSRSGVGGGGGGNSHILGYGMCHLLRVLFWLENIFLGLFCSL